MTSFNHYCIGQTNHFSYHDDGVCRTGVLQNIFCHRYTPGFIFCWIKYHILIFWLFPNFSSIVSEKEQKCERFACVNHLFLILLTGIFVKWKTMIFSFQEKFLSCKVLCGFSFLNLYLTRSDEIEPESSSTLTLKRKQSKATRNVEDYIVNSQRKRNYIYYRLWTIK